MHLIKNTIQIRWLCSCLVFFMYSCIQSTNPKITIESALKQNKKLQANLERIAFLKKMIKSGDIITRTGKDFTSQSLKTLNRKDKTFSHCGIASLENDSLFVYHALGGEWNPDQKIKRELFTTFCNPKDNNNLGIYRFEVKNTTTTKIINTSQLFYKSGITFDMDFDLKTDDKMYCAEFIYKAFLIATDSAIKFDHSFIKNFEFIGIDDIIHHPLSSKIALLNYEL